MKKFLKTKKRVWLPLVCLLLLTSMVLSVRLVANTNAKYVTGFEAEPTGISGVSDADLKQLLKFFLEERFPVGSVYMTVSTDLNDTTKMNTHFNQYGSTMNWVRIGQQRVPVGYAATNAVDGTVNFGNYFDAVPKTGGTGGGTGTGTYSISGTVTSGSTGLTAGGVVWDPVGSLTLPAKTDAVTLTNGPATLSAINYLPAVSHRHSFTYNTTRNIEIKSCGSPCGSGSISNLVNRIDALAYDAGGGWSVTISNFTGGNGFTVTIPAPNITNLPQYTNPTGVTLKNPTWDYGAQAISGFPLSFSYNDSATLADATMQPYVICHMYMRQS